jgi:hypothetical protein
MVVTVSLGLSLKLEFKKTSCGPAMYLGQCLFGAGYCMITEIAFSLLPAKCNAII